MIKKIRRACNIKISRIFPPLFAGNGVFVLTETGTVRYTYAMLIKETENTAIHAVVENNYITSVWFRNSLKGLEETAKNHKMTVAYSDDISSVPACAGVVVLVGSTKDWIRRMLEGAREKNIRPILIGGVPGSYGEDVSGTMYGSKSTIDEMVRYYYFYNRRRVALVDINQNNSNDCAKYEAFLNAVKALGMEAGYSDVYFKDPSSYNPTANFLKRIREYDGVICSNDYSAGYILTYCRENKIRVPEDLFVAGLGDMAICRYTRPSLTSATRSYYEAGVQVFRIYRTLMQNPDVESVVTTMKSSLKPRESTACLPVAEEIANGPFRKPGEETENGGPNVGDGVSRVRGLEACLNQCDGRDLKIIAGVLGGTSNEQLAETLSCSVGTINYRLKNLYKAAGVSTKSELADLIRRNLNAEALIRDAENPDWER